MEIGGVRRRVFLARPYHEGGLVSSLGAGGEARQRHLRAGRGGVRGNDRAAGAGVLAERRDFAFTPVAAAWARDGFAGRRGGVGRGASPPAQAPTQQPGRRRCARASWGGRG